MWDVGNGRCGGIRSARLETTCRATGIGDEIRRRFGKSVAETSGRGDMLELALAKPTVIDNVVLMEQITEGHRVRQDALDGLVGGRWTGLAHGQSIGHKRIDRFPPIEVTKIRFRRPKLRLSP